MKYKIIAIIFVLGFALSGCSLKVGKIVNDLPRVNEPVACTMEAKICPDGSAVGRSGPNCEFSVCPNLIPVKATSSVKIYFGNSNLNPNSIDCSKVYSVERNIQSGADTELVALNELFKGQTADEKKQGYTSWFSNQTKDILKSLKINEGVAYVDLIDIRNLIPNASASCGSAALLSEMEQTLKQFPVIKKVIFSIDGNKSTFYEWLQLSAPKE